MNAGGLGPAAYEGAMRTDNYVMRRDDGVRNLIDDDILEPLPQELLHRFRSNASIGLFTAPGLLNSSGCLIDRINVCAHVFPVSGGVLELATRGQSVVAPVSILVVHKAHIRNVAGYLVVLRPATSAPDNDVVVKSIGDEAIVENGFRSPALRHRRAVPVHAPAGRRNTLGSSREDAVRH